MTKEKKVLDQIIKEIYADKSIDPREAILGEDGLLKQLTKALMERCLETELSDHLGYEKNEQVGKSSENRRNGHSRKRVTGNQGEISIEVPRDRNAEFEPQLILKHQTRIDGLDDKILSLYARGMTVRDIQSQVKELYGTEISPTLISNITDSVMDEVRSWQNRPLDNVYPVVFFDALVVKVRENQRVTNKSLYIALAINKEGHKEILGMWISQNEGAKFWLSILTELTNRGVQDIFIACVDGLTGMQEAIETAYPKTWVQLCLVHMVRNSLKYVSYKDRREMANDLKTIYRVATESEAEINLNKFAEKWDSKYPTISKSWKQHWSKIIPMFVFPDEIRKVIYTTNPVESVNMTLRKASRNHRIFPSNDSVFKVMYLAIKNISKKWTQPFRDWGATMSRFAIEFEGRIPF